jgi:hypothetical protein
MKMIRRFLVIVTFIAMSSCVTSYQPSGFMGGYEDIRESNERYFVTFSANGYTSAPIAYQLFLTRAASLAKSRGYRYFYVLQSDDISKTETYYTQGSASTTATSNVYGTYSRYGNRGYLNARVYTKATTTYSPPIAYDVNKPGFRGEILFVNEPIKDQPPPFDADMIYRDGMDLKAQLDGRNMIVGTLFGVGTVLLLVVTFAF